MSRSLNPCSVQQRHDRCAGHAAGGHLRNHGIQDPVRGLIGGSLFAAQHSCGEERGDA
ncbi:hypothetical protein [Fodinicola feengrottensis]|uniref:hypothetical protein n=1 Tax=Fodinicola feengrottensis TaxID=435914 RepID=UPI0031DD5F0A